MGMGMDKITTRSYALRVQRLRDAIKDLEECALDFPEVRDSTLDLLESYSDTSKQYSGELKKAAEDIAAVDMLEILHGA